MTNSLGARGKLLETGRGCTDIDVAVIGVHALPSPTGAAGVEPTAWTAAEDYAALVRDRTSVRVGHLLLAHRGADAVATRIAGLPVSVSAAFAVGMSQSQSACMQLKAATLDGPLVISEFDIVAAVLCAAAINTLRRHKVAPRLGRIVVMNPEALPRLQPLLRTAGIATLTIWNDHDAGGDRLRKVMAHHDVLIDLAGTAPPTAAPGRTLTLPGQAFDYGSLVLLGLLSALSRYHAASLTIDILEACARAVAAIAPPARILPAMTERLLVPTVASQVARVLGARLRPAGPDGRRDGGGAL